MALSAATRGVVDVVARQIPHTTQAARECDSSNVVACSLARTAQSNVDFALLGAAELLMLRNEEKDSTWRLAVTCNAPVFRES